MKSKLRRFNLIASLTAVVFVWYFCRTLRQINLNNDFLQAVKDSRIDKVRILLDQGADVNAAELESPDIQGFWDRLKYLLHSHPTSSYHPALLIATKTDSNIAQLLVLHGADVNIHDADGNTPLILSSCRDDNVNLVKLLLARRANINAVNKEGITPLANAVFRDAPQMASLLLDCGANVNAVRTDGFSILAGAISVGEPSLVKRLLDKGADFTIRTWNGDAAVHTAAAASTETPLGEKSNIICLQLLAEHKADINAINNLGDTALMVAINSQNAGCANFLLDAGADISIRDKYGYTAIDYAYLYDKRLVKRLRKMGAKE